MLPIVSCCVNIITLSDASLCIYHNDNKSDDDLACALQS